MKEKKRKKERKKMKEKRQKKKERKKERIIIDRIDLGIKNKEIKRTERNK